MQHDQQSFATYRCGKPVGTCDDIRTAKAKGQHVALNGKNALSIDPFSTSKVDRVRVFGGIHHTCHFLQVLVTGVLATDDIPFY